MRTSTQYKSVEFSNQSLLAKEVRLCARTKPDSLMKMQVGCEITKISTIKVVLTMGGTNERRTTRTIRMKTKAVAKIWRRSVLLMTVVALTKIAIALYKTKMKLIASRNQTKMIHMKMMLQVTF